MVNNAPPKNSARGIVRRGALISSAMKDAVSLPAKAKVRTDQKTMSLRRVVGVSVARVNDVADPKRHHARVPIPISKAIGTHIPTAPALFSHLPTLRPRMCKSVPSSSAEQANIMKKAGLFDSPSHWLPPM